MLRKMREIETESGFAKQRGEREGVCWKEAISRVSNAAPALSPSLLDFGRKWMGQTEHKGGAKHRFNPWKSTGSTRDPTWNPVLFAKFDDSCTPE